MPSPSDEERNQDAPHLPSLEDIDRWAVLAAAVKAQDSFDSVGFTAERPIDLRSDDPVENE